MGRPSRLLESLRTGVEQRVSREFASDIFEPSKPLSPEEELEARRSELRKGLTDRQRLFLFGKLGGLNDKDAAIAAGYSVSVAENTKQRIWKPRVRAEFERFEWGSLAHVARSDDGWPLFDRTNRGRLSKVDPK